MTNRQRREHRHCCVLLAPARRHVVDFVCERSSATHPADRAHARSAARRSVPPGAAVKLMHFGLRDETTCAATQCALWDRVRWLAIGATRLERAARTPRGTTQLGRRSDRLDGLSRIRAWRCRSPSRIHGGRPKQPSRVQVPGSARTGGIALYALPCAVFNRGLGQSPSLSQPTSQKRAGASTGALPTCGRNTPQPPFTASDATSCNVLQRRCASYRARARARALGRILRNVSRPQKH